jgi:hypothetical protein
VSATDLYEFAVTEAAVPIQPFLGIEEAQNQDENLVNLTTATSTEVAAADRYSVAVRNPDGVAGLTIGSFGYITEGGPPA